MNPSPVQPEPTAPSTPTLKTAERERRALAARVAALHEGRELPPTQPVPTRVPRPIRYSGLRTV